MIFVLDVGNTNMVLGVYHENRLIHHWRIATSWSKTEDEYAMIVKSLFSHVGLTFSDIRGIIISSVVPPIMFPQPPNHHSYLHCATSQSFIRRFYPACPISLKNVLPSAHTTDLVHR